MTEPNKSESGGFYSQAYLAKRKAAGGGTQPPGKPSAPDGTAPDADAPGQDSAVAPSASPGAPGGFDVNAFLAKRKAAGGKPAKNAPPDEAALGDPGVLPAAAPAPGTGATEPAVAAPVGAKPVQLQAAAKPAATPKPKIVLPAPDTRTRPGVEVFDPGTGRPPRRIARMAIMIALVGVVSIGVIAGTEYFIRNVLASERPRAQLAPGAAVPQ